MEAFLWNMAISYQLLFIILSSTIFIYLREKSFRFYALYNTFLLLYMLSRPHENRVWLEGICDGIVGTENTRNFLYVLLFWIQITFYTAYSYFALHFLDLELHCRKFFQRVKLTLRILLAIMFIMGIASYVQGNTKILWSTYTFVFLPALLSMFVATVINAVKFSGAHRNFFLIGLSFFVFFAVFAFYTSYADTDLVENPMLFFYLGLIIETLFFSLGLAHKINLLNGQRTRARREMIKSKHKQQLGKLHGLLEGEERERKRLAAELHDGIASDLSAIKYNLSRLAQQNDNLKNNDLLAEMFEHIDKTSVQIREISHNLSLSTITDLGLHGALLRFCLQVERANGISIECAIKGEPVFTNTVTEIHIYRIVQELITNIVKHAEAESIEVEFLYEEKLLTITIKDDGKGFSPNPNKSGIGLSNIHSRIQFLNASFTKENSDKGTVCTIKIDLRKSPKM